MTTPQIISSILLVIAAILIFSALRAEAIVGFRQKWRDYMADSPEAIATYHRRMPSPSKMFWTFWKPIKDSAWIPADLRAAKYTADLDPDTREKLMKWAASKNESPNTKN